MSPHTIRRPAARLTAAFVLLATTGLAGCASFEDSLGLRANSGYDPNLSTASIPGQPSVQTGVAAWDGDISAPGMKAAHPTLMVGSWARVTNAHSGQTAVVEITRRLEGARDRDIELSRDAAVAVGALHEGFATVLIEPIDPLQATAEEKRMMTPATPAAPRPRQPAVVETAAYNNSRGAYVGYDPNLATASTPTQGVAYEPLPPATPVVAAPRPAAQPAPQAAVVRRPAAPAQPSPIQGARYLQIGAFREPGNAKRVENAVRSEGLASGAYGDVFIQAAYVNGSLYHRVRLGPIESQDLAERALIQARRNGHQTAKILRP